MKYGSLNVLKSELGLDRRETGNTVHQADQAGMSGVQNISCPT